jgi:hypothetical protein
LKKIENKEQYLVTSKIEPHPSILPSLSDSKMSATSSIVLSGPNDIKGKIPISSWDHLLETVEKKITFTPMTDSDIVSGTITCMKKTYDIVISNLILENPDEKKMWRCILAYIPKEGHVSTVKLYGMHGLNVVDDKVVIEDDVIIEDSRRRKTVRITVTLTLTPDALRRIS